MATRAAHPTRNRRRLKGAIAVAAAVLLAAPFLPKIDAAGATTAVDCTNLDMHVLPSGDIVCTHGADFPQAQASGTPAMVDPSVPVPYPDNPNPSTCAEGTTTGPRVQVLYGFVDGRANNVSAWTHSIRHYAAQANQIFIKSARQTGGNRRMRFVRDSYCNIHVATVRVPAGATNGDQAFTKVTQGLRNAGHNRTDRKYLVYYDDTVLCGIGDARHDDERTNNIHDDGSIPGMVAIAARPCWADNGLTAAHEVAHTMGAVQFSAFNATWSQHCTDEYDVMCYVDKSGEPMNYYCPSHERDHTLLLDCRHDDYFHTNPAAGTYLAGHWNVADSSYLIRGPDMSNQWHLSNSRLSNPADPIVTHVVTAYGRPDDRAVPGDWDGAGGLSAFHGSTTLGVTRLMNNGTRWFPTNAITSPTSLPDFLWGQRGVLTLAGDWDGEWENDGIGVVAVRNPINPGDISELGWDLNTTVDTSSPDYRLVWGFGGDSGDHSRLSDVPVVGDWDGNGTVTTGVVRGGSNGQLQWFLRDRNAAGAAYYFSFTYGRVGDMPVVGDWNNDGKFTAGIVRIQDGRLFWHLTDTHTGGSPTIPVFAWGIDRDIPITGDWNGDGWWTIGIRR
ncbi:MAG TPA: hypothetical protein VG318_09580 [Actinomycetota bacterium]|nr:hypothetical protein [Actinomycetota bacterium]